MRIGIDARFLTHPQPGGFKTYTVNLLDGLAQVDKTNEYLIVVDRTQSFEARLPARSRMLVVEGQGSVKAVLREQRRLMRALDEEGAEIVHLLANTAPLYASIPLVTTLHDVISLESGGGPARLPRLWQKQYWVSVYYRNVIRLTSKRAAAIVTVSEYEKQNIVRRLQIPPERIHVTPLSASRTMRPYSTSELTEARQMIATRYGIERPYLLGIGFEPRKNIETVLLAFSRVSIECSKLSLVLVVAHKSTRQSLLELLTESGLHGRVTILPEQTQEDLAGLYNCASILLYPSLRESFGLPPLEAMACGTPVITTNRTSIPEVVGDAVWTVDPRDIDEIVGATMKVLGEPDCASELRRKGLKRASEFSWTRTAEKTLEVYETVWLNQTSRSSGV